MAIRISAVLVGLGLASLACTTPEGSGGCPVCPVCPTPEVPELAAAEAEPAGPAGPAGPAESEPAEAEDVEPPSEDVFTAAPVPWHEPVTLVAKRKRSCEVEAIIDPEVRVIYTDLDVFVALAQSLEIDDRLPGLANGASGEGESVCGAGGCRPGTPNPIVIDDGDGIPLNGFSVGFTVALGDGNWVLPLSEYYRVYHCMPESETEQISEDHGRITVRHNRAEGEPCDESNDEEDCGVGCVYAGATQYDLFYDRDNERALLLTRDYAKLDEDDAPTPTIEVVREDQGVRVTGCGVDQVIRWPAGF